MRLRLCVTLMIGVIACGGGDKPIVEPGPASVETVSLAPLLTTLTVGGSQTLTPTLRDVSGNVLRGRTVIWSTSDAGIATVSDGVVTGVGEGTATITATAGRRSAVASASVSAGGARITFASFATGGAHTCALAANGSAYCWGRGESGQLGVSPPATVCTFDQSSLACTNAPVAVQGGLTFAQLTAGGAHTCGLTSDGTAYCWGRNLSGQLGDNSFTSHPTPTAVATTLKFASIDAGGHHSCALTASGVAYCWGRNARGSLGDATTTDRSVPTPVLGDLTFQQIKAGGFEDGAGTGFTCGLTMDGHVYCWGDNERGQLGNGGADLNAHTQPSAASTAVLFTALTVGLGRHACAISPAASYCWGENSFGALGIGTTTDRSVPTLIDTDVKFTSLIAGGYIGHTCGLSQGTVPYCWGENSIGAIGDGTQGTAARPVHVAGGLSFTAIDAGFRHTCGLATTGVLYCWGSGRAGQLGTNSFNASFLPAKVVGQP